MAWKRASRALVWVWVMACLVRASVGQEEAVEEVEATVTSVTADQVYLDVGRRAHIEPGDPIRVSASDGTFVRGEVLAVSSSSSRAGLDSTAPVDIGARAVVFVPAERFQEDELPEEDVQVEQEGTQLEEPPAPRVLHPPWSHPPEDWATDTPLLAGARARRPEERPRRLHGRLRWSTDSTWDRGTVDNAFLSTALGVRLDLENPFHSGGHWIGDFNVFHRFSDLSQSFDTSETEFVPRRFYYEHGFSTGLPTAFQVGRFLQRGMAEFGVLDGYEVSRFLGNGNAVGASLGFLPLREDDLTTGDDFQVALTHRLAFDSEEDLVLNTGFQKTWHGGIPDRDLLVTSLDVRPGGGAWFQFTGWVDFYTAHDHLKDDPLEVTQIQTSGGYSTTRFGASLTAARVRFPQLLREEYAGIPDSEIAGSTLSRLALNGWTRIDERFRLSARSDLWRDEDSSGGGIELRLDARDWLYEHGEVGVAIFSSEGRFSSGTGLRLSATRHFTRGSLRCSYDLTGYGQESDVSGTDTVLHHSFTASYGRQLGKGWNLDVFVQDQLREDQNSLAVGVSIQKGF